MSLNRRDFGGLVAAAGASLLLPGVANAKPVREGDVMITTPDGQADAYFVHPAKGRHPAVLIWPDIQGLRPAFRQMGKRLAESGYAVLVVNPFYRMAKAPVVAPGESFQDPAVRAKLLPMAQALNAKTHVSDAQAFVAWLDTQKPVNTKRKMATTGYCMGGPIVMRTAAALPGRIGAGATFHGGGLATVAADSPHLLVPQMKAQFLIAIAENDDAREPDAKTVLGAAFSAAKLQAEIEVYKAALHGWCPPDSRVYNAAQAERAWSQMLALFRRAL
jgi:carboxymethylenebutenolidase